MSQAPQAGGAAATPEVAREVGFEQPVQTAPVDRVKLYIEQGSEHGWDQPTFSAALAELAGVPRDTVLAMDLKPRYAYVVVRPEAKDAYLAMNGKPLKDKPLRLEVAKPSRRR